MRPLHRRRRRSRRRRRRRRHHHHPIIIIITLSSSSSTTMQSHYVESCLIKFVFDLFSLQFVSFSFMYRQLFRTESREKSD